MKPICARHTLTMLMAAAITLLNHPAFGQAPTARGGSSGDVPAGEAARTAASETVIARRVSASLTRTATRITAATVGFFPSSAFALPAEPGVEDDTAITPPQFVSRGTGQVNDNSPASVAMKLRNPVSSLSRISFENNLDFGMAANREGYRYTMLLKPVVPFRLGEDWNLISRTEVPLIQQDGIDASTVQTGLGDILQTFFISPSKGRQFFWGAGTTLLIPTATDTRLGAGKFGIGPALVVGRQQSAWTYGVLARQIWSVTGHSDRADVRSTYFQPFVAYTTRSAWTFAADTESSFDWVGRQWSAPIHLEVTKALRIGRFPVNVGGALTCWVASPPGGPQACGVRFIVTPTFPAR